jgi:hypothetical protein
MNRKKHLFVATLVALTAVLLPKQLLPWSYNTQISSSGCITMNGHSLVTIGGPVTMVNGVITSSNSTPIKLTGKMKERSFDTPVNNIAVQRYIATTHIVNSTERPRIECDEAADDLIFNVHNGEITAETKDGKSLIFEGKDLPLCKVYAQLISDALKASNHAEVFFENQDLSSISSCGHAKISGSVKKRSSLDLSAKSHGSVQVNGINSSTVNITTSSHGKITASGTTENQKIKASSHARYNGSKLKTCNAHVDVSQHASVELQVNTDLNGHATNFGSVKNYGTAHNNVKASNFGKSK